MRIRYACGTGRATGGAARAVADVDGLYQLRAAKSLYKNALRGLAHAGTGAAAQG